MASQRRILRRLSEPEALARVRDLLEAEASLHRTALAERLCVEYDFFDPAGRAQRSSCLKALRTLAGRGHFVLPPPRTVTAPRTLAAWGGRFRRRKACRRMPARFGIFA